MPADMKLVEAVFARLMLVFGNRVAKLYEGMNLDLVKRAWAVELEGLTPQEIEAGLEAVKGERFPPTAPEFVRACRPYLDPTVAWYYAQHGMNARRVGEHGEWPHPAIYWAALEFGPSDVTGMTTSSAMPRWTATLKKWVDMKHWEPVPPVGSAPALPAPTKDATKAHAQFKAFLAKWKERPPSEAAQIAERVGMRALDSVIGGGKEC
jgi:hypothetical protein